MNNSDRPIAFFDFDGTLTTGDTLMPFLHFVVGKRVYYLKLIVLSPILTGYFLRLIRNDFAKQVVLRYYLSGYSNDELIKHGEVFSRDVLPKMHRKEGMERLRWHQSQDHECILVSASLDLYLKPWAEDQGFSEVITSSLESNQGKVSGSLKGKNCHGEEKARLIMERVKGIEYRESYAYGDTSGDNYMLNIVRYGYKRNKSIFVKYSAPRSS